MVSECLDGYIRLYQPIDSIYIFFSKESFKIKTLHQVRYIIVAKEKSKLKIQVVFGLAAQSLFEILLATQLKPDMIYAFDVSFFFFFFSFSLCQHSSNLICACDVSIHIGYIYKYIYNWYIHNIHYYIHCTNWFGRLR